MHASNQAKAVFYTVLAGALWGTSFPIIKIGLATIDPFTFVFWRFLVSALSLALVMIALGKMRFNFVKLQYKRLFIFLGLANGLGYLLQYIGMPYTTSAKAALFINLSAIWTAVLSPRLLGEHFSIRKVTGILFGLAGIIFVSTNLDFTGLADFQLFGDALLIISGITWALFMIYNKKMVMGSTSEVFQNMIWVLIFTFLTIAPFAVFAGPGFFSLSFWGWSAVLWTAIVCWVIPYFLWLEGLKHLSASVSTVLLLSEIVVAVILSIAVLNEPVTVFSTIGAFLIVIAIALVSIQDKEIMKKQDNPK